LKNVIITGASGGIGKDVALHFAENGWVIATMLCLEHGKTARIKNINCYVLDVSSTQRIMQLLRKVY
jgi:NAD(P)-dependent dehydrogenase (short-subunit alcohol dehydrogenase family)